MRVRVKTNLQLLLSGPSQFVEKNESKSNPLKIDISVIKGSIFWVRFFSYITDFYAATSLFSVLLADDIITCMGQGKTF